MEIILLSILAHAIADFVLQTDKIIYHKRAIYTHDRKILSNLVQGYLMHGVQIFLLMFVFLLNYDTLTVLRYSLVLSITHIVFDLVKELFNRGKPLLKVFVFLTDQLLHILIIANICKLFEFDYTGTLTSFLSFITGPSFISIIDNINFISCIWLIFFVYVVFGGAYFIPLIFDVIFGKNFDERKMDYMVDEQDSSVVAATIEEGTKAINVKTGKTIGILERSIMFILLIGGSYATIGFTIAVKSLTRYDLLKNRYFAEYYLIGTLLSVFLTLLGYNLYILMLKG